MADEDPLPYYWLDLVSVGRLIKVVFFRRRTSRFCSTVSSEFHQSVPILEEQLSLSNPRHSHGFYDIYLGLHPYVQHGGGSGLEIEVEFHERAVPLSTLPAIYRYHHESLLSV